MLARGFDLQFCRWSPKAEVRSRAGVAGGSRRAWPPLNEPSSRLKRKRHPCAIPGGLIRINTPFACRWQPLSNESAGPEEDRMRVKDVMTRMIVSVSQQASVAEAIRLMVKRHVSGLPVIDEAGTLVGVLSEGDLLRRIEIGTSKPVHWLEYLFRPGHLADVYKQTHGRKVEEIMSTNVSTIDQNLPLESAVSLMEKRHVKRLPVMDGEKLVGIITRADFIRALASFVSESYDELPRSDVEIRRSLLAEVASQSWAPKATIDVDVRDGVVQLHGAIIDERQRDAIKVAAENVPGVRETHDHMIWVDPIGATVLQSQEDAARVREEIRRGI
jgi:CBS domain-containing protein